MSTNNPLERLEEISRSIAAKSEALKKTIEADREAHRESTEKREEAARRGELGDDWRKIQERIDSGETTLRDVFSGKDTSDAAAALRQTAQRNITKSIEKTRQAAGDAEDPLSVLQEELAAVREENERRARHFRDM